MGVSCSLLARRIAEYQAGMLGTAMCRTTYRADDAVHPLPVLAYVWKWKRRQACVSTYRGKLAHPELEVES